MRAVHAAVTVLMIAGFVPGCGTNSVTLRGDDANSVVIEVENWGIPHGESSVAIESDDEILEQCSSLEAAHALISLQETLPMIGLVEAANIGAPLVVLATPHGVAVTQKTKACGAIGHRMRDGEGLHSHPWPW